MRGGEGREACIARMRGRDPRGRIRMMTIEHTIQYLGEAMPETTKMMRAWRTDSVEGLAAAAGRRRRRPPSAVAWGRRSPGRPVAAWSRSFGRRAAGSRRPLHRFTADAGELDGSRGHRGGPGPAGRADRAGRARRADPGDGRARVLQEVASRHPIAARSRPIGQTPAAAGSRRRGIPGALRGPRATGCCASTPPPRAIARRPGRRRNGG